MLFFKDFDAKNYKYYAKISVFFSVSLEGKIITTKTFGKSQLIYFLQCCVMTAKDTWQGCDVHELHEQSSKREVMIRKLKKIEQFEKNNV